jgi:hypothetical protein
MDSEERRGHKIETSKIVVWRLAGIIIPWITIFSMFLIAHEKYLKMESTADAFPKIVEKVQCNTQDILTLKEIVGFLRENSKQTNDKLEAINQTLIRLASRREG